MSSVKFLSSVKFFWRGQDILDGALCISGAEVTPNFSLLYLNRPTCAATVVADWSWLFRCLRLMEPHFKSGFDVTWCFTPSQPLRLYQGEQVLKTSYFRSFPRAFLRLWNLSRSVTFAFCYFVGLTHVDTKPDVPIWFRPHSFCQPPYTAAKWFILLQFVLFALLPGISGLGHNVLVFHIWNILVCLSVCRANVSGHHCLRFFLLSFLCYLLRKRRQQFRCNRAANTPDIQNSYRHSNSIEPNTIV